MDAHLTSLHSALVRAFPWLFMVGVQQALARRGAWLLYLPPCSPDLSPIELCVSKLKPALQAAKARTFEALETEIRAAMEAVTALDACH